VNNVLAVFCLSLSACDSSLPGHRHLQRGMTEQQVTELEGKQAPDRIMMRTCGADAQTVSLQVHVYQKGLWAGRDYHELSVVFEDVQGQWVVSQWL
jgi:hypothetical protein